MRTRMLSRMAQQLNEVAQKHSLAVSKEGWYPVVKRGHTPRCKLCLVGRCLLPSSVTIDAQGEAFVFVLLFGVCWVFKGFDRPCIEGQASLGIVCVRRGTCV